MSHTHSAYTKAMLMISGWLVVLLAFVLPISTSLCDIAFLLSVFFVFLSGVWRGQIVRIVSNPIVWFLLGFFVLMLLGGTYTIASSHALKGYYVKMSRVPLAIVLLPLFWQKRWKERAINAFLVSMVVTLILVYVKRYTGWGLPVHYPNFTADSIFKDHIIQSFLMNMACFFFLYRAVVSRGWMQWLMIVLVALMAFDLVFISQSRTGTVVFFGLCLFCALHYWNWRGVLFGTAVACVLVVLAYQLSSDFHNNFSRVVKVLHTYKANPNQPSSTGQRLTKARRAWIIYKQAPILGHGTGSIRVAYNDLLKVMPGPAFASGDDANTVYLNFMVQWGAIGIVFYLFFLLYLWCASKNLDEASAFMMKALLMALIIGGIFNSWFKDTTEGHFIVLYGVLLYSGWKQKSI